MFQTLKDFQLKIKSDRKTQVLTALVSVALVWLFFGETTHRRTRRPETPVQVGAGDPNDRWTDLIERFNLQLTSLTAESKATKEDMIAVKKNMQDYEATTAEIFKKILERLAEVGNNTNDANGAAGPKTLVDLESSPIDSNGPDTLVGLGDATVVAENPPPQPKKVKLASIMPGDSVRIKLLAGVNAPTDGSPYPVVVKVIGDVQGPDGNSLPIGEARMIAAAQGSLTDHRVLFRLTRMSMRLPNGRRKEFAVDGWIVGEDGIRGMDGILIDPIGQIIAASAIAGGVSGLGQGIAQGNTVNNQNNLTGAQTSFVQNGQIPQYAGGLALSSAAQEYSQIVRQRAAQLVPVVQALSGREATAIFSQSLAIPDLLNQLEDEDPSVAFVSMD
jgi:hypothetical protein